MYDKEKTCHDLALEYAKIEIQKENIHSELLGSFELHERFLCIYDWCYNDLLKNFDTILKRYHQLKSENNKPHYFL